MLSCARCIEMCFIRILPRGSIFIYFNPNAGTSICVGWTYYHKNDNDKTVLTVFGNDLSIINPDIVDSYPDDGSSGQLFTFWLYDSDTNDFGEIDLLEGFPNLPLNSFADTGQDVINSLVASNIFGCEDPNAFNEDPVATAPCLDDDSECQICGYPITNFNPIGSVKS